MSWTEKRIQVLPPGTVVYVANYMLASRPLVRGAVFKVRKFRYRLVFGGKPDSKWYDRGEIMTEEEHISRCLAR